MFLNIFICTTTTSIIFFCQLSLNLLILIWTHHISNLPFPFFYSSVFSSFLFSSFLFFSFVLSWTWVFLDFNAKEKAGFGGNLRNWDHCSYDFFDYLFLARALEDPCLLWSILVGPAHFLTYWEQASLDSCGSPFHASKTLTRVGSTLYATNVWHNLSHTRVPAGRTCIIVGLLAEKGGTLACLELMRFKENRYYYKVRKSNSTFKSSIKYLINWIIKYSIFMSVFQNKWSLMWKY